MTKLFKRNSKGQIQEWEVKVEGDTFYTVEGLVGGKLTTSKPTKCYPKNVGKSNETTGEEQALLEAKSKFQKKLNSGYAEKVEDSGKDYFECMLAESYRDTNGNPIKSIESFVWNSPHRKFVQPKLDGLRTINMNNSLQSREGKQFTTCPHLTQKGEILDGELYNHSFKDDFNAIVSLIKKTKPEKEDIEKARELAQMWVYDMPSIKGTFSVRYEALRKWFDKNSKEYPSLVLVPTYEIKSLKDLEKFHNTFKSMGFEGTILRMDDRDYEGKRTTQLIKYKDFTDSEFEIIGYVEGKGGRSGTIGKFILRHDKYPSESFKCNVKGDFKYLTEIWNNRDSYIGKTATVKYFNRTPRKNNKGDVPRFGYIVKIDRESYE